MSDLVMRAAELIAVIIKQRVDEDTSNLRAQLMVARGELADTRLYADNVANERDAARAELAGVAAQRDAHLSRTVELAARVTELEAFKAQATRNEAALKARASTLEARLAALTSVVVEVDGFRVGDLVRFNGDVLPLLEVFFDETVGYSFGTVECDSPYRRKSCSQLHHMVRKPVEVGDTVRVTRGVFKDRRGKLMYVDADEAYEAEVEFADGIAVAHLADLVVVAP